MYFFMHIPRTMGTALKDQCIYPNYEPSQVILDLSWKDAISLPPSRYTNVRVTCGHVGINLESVAKRPIKTFTMLRDPIYRGRSMYHFCKRVVWHWLHYKARNMTIEEFVSDPETAPLITNMQARWLVNVISYEGLRSGLGQYPTRGDIEHKFFGMLLDMPEGELLKQAIFKLDRLFFFGLANRFYDTAHAIWKLLGIDNPRMGADIARQMHPYLRARHYSLNKTEYEALKSINRVDLELLQYARQKFDDNISQI